MTENSVPSPQASGAAISRRWQVLGGVLLAATVWPVLRLVLELIQRFNSLGVWLALAGVLPFVALSAAGSIGLLKGQRRGCWLIWAAAVLSWFRWPFPDLPIMHSWWTPRIAFPGPRPVEWSLVQGLNALTVLLMLIGYWRSRALPTGPKWRFRTISMVLLVAILAVVGSRFGLHRFDQSAGLVLDRGNQAFEAGRMEEAEALWRQVTDQYTYTPSWGKALYNISFAYRRQEHWQEAIPLLETLLASDLNDTDPSANLMAPYQNYHHQACLGLADCYEHLEDYPAALHYARLAQDAYPYRTWSGTCLIESRRALRQSVRRLEQKSAGTYRQQAGGDEEKDAP